MELICKLHGWGCDHPLYPGGIANLTGLSVYHIYRQRIYIRYAFEARAPDAFSGGKPAARFQNRAAPRVSPSVRLLTKWQDDTLSAF